MSTWWRGLFTVSSEPIRQTYVWYVFELDNKNFTFVHLLLLKDNWIIFNEAKQKPTTLLLLCTTYVSALLFNTEIQTFNCYSHKDAAANRYLDSKGMIITSFCLTVHQKWSHFLDTMTTIVLYAWTVYLMP